jgi:putative ABC transport system substrate-binding protein
MRRREFITGFGAVAWPVMARAQPARLPTIGFLGQSTAAAESQRVVPFVQRLRELGWSEGRTVAIEYRWAEGRGERYAEIAAEFVSLKVSVIVTQGPAAIAAKQVTSSLPIVFAVANNPIKDGLVTSLPRPGGNLTGLSLQQSDLAGKRLELFREIRPGLRRLAVMANVGNPGYPSATFEMDEVQAAADTLGFEVTKFPIRRSEDIAPAFEALKGRVEALYLIGDPLITTNRTRISTLALAAQLPTMYGNREYVEAGGMVSYGPYFSDLYRRAADYVDKILHGVKPGDLPVEQPTKFYLVINLTTAKALGLSVPPTLLARADEVIE